VPGQCGTLLAVDGTYTLDWVSRPEAWDRLHARVVRGYALDAMERLDRKPADEDALEAFLAATAEAPRATQRSPGLGDDVRLRAERVVGSGLELDGELLQLSAFSRGGADAQPPIVRPSRRR